MFENVKTYCKMASEQEAINHAEVMQDNSRTISTGTQYTEQHGWRSWFEMEQWTGDVVSNKEEVSDE